MRTIKPRKYEWINGNLVKRPQTESYRKFLEATLPHAVKYSKYNIGNLEPKGNDETDK
jgi:hypothetical protein